MVGLPAGPVAGEHGPAVRKGELHDLAEEAVGAEAAASEAWAQGPQHAELSMASPESSVIRDSSIGDLP
jgi:hypothetical protein